MKAIAAAVLLLALTWLAATALLIAREAGRTSNNRADVAVVLGAAVGKDGGPSPVLEGRLEHGLALYRSGQVRKLLFTGGRGSGAGLAESEAARHWALRHRVPAGDMLVEDRSHTTRQNLVEAHRVMRSRKLRTALVVSDPLHLPRALRMARDLGMVTEPSPTPSTRFRSRWTRATFLAREAFFLNFYWLTGD